MRESKHAAVLRALGFEPADRTDTSKGLSFYRMEGALSGTTLWDEFGNQWEAEASIDMSPKGFRDQSSDEPSEAHAQ